MIADGRDVGDQALNLLGVGEVGPAELDAAAAVSCAALTVGGRVEIGDDDAAAQSAASRRTVSDPDQAEATGDEHSFRHYISYLRI